MGGLLAAVGAARLARRDIGERLVEDGFCARDVPAYFRDAVEEACEATRFEVAWQLNRPPREECLNVYLVDSRAVGSERLERDLVDNCAFVGEPNVIVCDLRFIERFLMERGFSLTPDTPPDPDSESARSFCTWIVAHEVGHVLRGHAPSHFRQARLEEEVRSATVAHAQEFEADAHILDVIRRQPREDISIASMLIGVVNSELQRKLTKMPMGVGIHFDYTGQEFVEYSRRGTHPEFVVRATRLLERYFEEREDVGWTNLLRSFVKTMRESAELDD